MHDLGKIGLSAALLEKPGPLTSSERIEMERHPEIAETILRKVDTYAEVAQIVRHHHERVDGQGYPDRLQGDNIPLISRILAVVDAYDAMTSDRPYRRAMAAIEARNRLQQAAGLQFDIRIVAAFDRILEESSAEVRVPRARTNDAARSRRVRETLSKVG